MKLQPGPLRSDRPFHLANEKYGAASVKRALETGLVTKEDADLIVDFVAELKATCHIGPSRFNKITQTLIKWRHLIGPFSSNTIRNIHRGIIALETATYERFCPPYIKTPQKYERKHLYKQNTKHDMVKCLKRFYLWLIEQECSKISQSDIRKIQPPSCDPLTKNADDLLSPEEIVSLIRGCQNSRDRAIIATLYESGVRIQELATLSWSQVTFDEYGVIINIDARTGKKTCKPRYIRLVMAREYLSTWHDDYPFQPEGKSLVFLTSRGRPLQYSGVAKQIREIAERVNIRKNITPHLFRHSRITHLLQQGYSIQTIKLMMWGSLSTEMIGVYAHLSSRDVDAEVLERNGIRVSHKASINAVPVHQCPHCQGINGPTSNFCHLCGRPLTRAATASQEEVMRFIESHPDLLEIISRGSRNVTTESV